MAPIMLKPHFGMKIFYSEFEMDSWLNDIELSHGESFQVSNISSLGTTYGEGDSKWTEQRFYVCYMEHRYPK